MKRTFTCPKCDTTLNPGLKIILVAQKRKRRGLILFSPKPGNYNAQVSPDLNLKEGDRVDLFCPVCGECLNSDLAKNLAEISFHLDNGMSGSVKFSRKFGEQATYFVTREQVRSYGDSADAYGGLNFFGESINKEK